MSEKLTTRATKQINQAIALGTLCFGIDDSTGMGRTEYLRFVSYAQAAIAAVTGEDSAFSRQIDSLLQTGWGKSAKAEGLVGILQAVEKAIGTGLLVDLKQTVRGELFADYLDMAEYLLDQGYKDAAAVIAGSSLEIHLQTLCEGRELPTTSERNGKQFPRKADQLNTELQKDGCYSKSVWKNVTSWLGIRNDAAHDNYGQYTSDGVKSMIVGVRDFIASHPA